MLKKLFAYDFRCMARPLLPILLSALIAAVPLCAFFCYYWYSYQPYSLNVLDFLYVMLLPVSVFAFLLLAVSPALILLLHVRSNFFGDEGYLTFVLPTGTHRLLLSKFFAGIVWTGICVLAGILCIYLVKDLPLALSQTGGAVTPTPDLPSTVNPDPAYILLSYAEAAVIIASQIIFLLFSATVGFLLIEKMKFFVSILIFIGINLLIPILISMIRSLSGLGFSLDTNWILAIVEILLYIGAGVGLYFLTVYLLRHRLNLE